MQRNLPGFFFDEETQRYYRIQENNAMGSNHMASRESVARRKRQALENDVNTTQPNLNYSGPFSHRGRNISGIERQILHETGAYSQSGISDHQKDLGMKYACEKMKMESIALPDEQIVSAIGFTSDSDKVVFASGYESMTSLNIRPVDKSRDDYYRYEYSLRVCTSLATSLTISRDGICVLTTLANEGSSGNVVMCDVANASNTGDLSTFSLYSPQPPADVWGSCVSEGSGKFSVGISHGLLYQASKGQSFHLQRLDSYKEKYNDIMTPCYIDLDNTIAVGTRNGSIYMFDTRSSAKEYSRVGNVHAQGGLELFAENYIVVCGNKGLKVLDKRFIPWKTCLDNLKENNNSSFIDKYTVFDFEHYHLGEGKKLAMTIDHSHGILASIVGRNKVGFWSLLTGSHLQTVPSQDSITAIKFQPNDDITLWTGHQVYQV